MTTLIAAYNSEGCTGRCDARCHNAKTPRCTCICGGMNHGVGRRQAVENTRRYAARWIEEWKAGHPDTERFDVPVLQPLFKEDNDMEYEFHELANVYPLMQGEEFAELVADIREHGLQEPIVLYEDKILDGRNRYRACLEAGEEPRFTLYSGDSPREFVDSMNMFRRHLTPEQLEAARERRRQRAAELREQGLSYRQIGEELGVSHAQAREDVAKGALETGFTMPPTITTSDGRSYPAERPAPEPEPEDIPFSDPIEPDGFEDAFGEPEDGPGDEDPSALPDWLRGDGGPEGPQETDWVSSMLEQAIRYLTLAESALDEAQNRATLYADGVIVEHIRNAYTVRVGAVLNMLNWAVEPGGLDEMRAAIGNLTGRAAQVQLAALMVDRIKAAQPLPPQKPDGQGTRPEGALL